MGRKVDRWMVPETVNVIHLAPGESAQARSEPAPESFRFVTWNRVPPFPPVVFLPKPTTFFTRSALHSSFAGRAALTSLSGANRNMTNRKKIAICIFFIESCLSFRSKIRWQAFDVGIKYATRLHISWLPILNQFVPKKRNLRECKVKVF